MPYTDVHGAINMAWPKAPIQSIALTENWPIMSGNAQGSVKCGRWLIQLIPFLTAWLVLPPRRFQLSTVDIASALAIVTSQCSVFSDCKNSVVTRVTVKGQCKEPSQMHWWRSLKFRVKIKSNAYSKININSTAYLWQSNSAQWQPECNLIGIVSLRKELERTLCLVALEI